MELGAYAITNAMPEIKEKYKENPNFKLTVIHHANIRIEVYLPKKTSTEMFHSIYINVNPKPHVKESIFTYDEIEFCQMKTVENDSEEYINQWKDFIKIYLKQGVINSESLYEKLNDRFDFDCKYYNKEPNPYTQWILSNDFNKLDLDQLLIKTEDDTEIKNFDEYLKFYKV